MSAIAVRIASRREEIRQAFKIREIVFIEEQKVPYELEMDEHDKDATHVIASLDREVVGCARIRFLGKKAKLERLAILSKYRNKGVGKEIMEFMVKHSREAGAVEAYGHAQCYAHDFYVKCGFKSRGDEFMEAGIRHIEMYMSLK